MNELMNYAFEDNLVRVHADENGEPWFVARDVCGVLEIQKPENAYSRLDEDERGTHSVGTPGGIQEMVTISESGLYALIFTSRKEEAKRFRKWVTSEVLPSIRKTGRYEMPGSTPTPEPRTPIDVERVGLRLRPNIRSQVLNQAVQIAKMEGKAQLEEVNEIYAELCRMIDPASPDPLEDGKDNIAVRFFDRCCRIAPEARTQMRDVYASFFKYCTKGEGVEQRNVPSQIWLSRRMREMGIFRAQKKPVAIYGVEVRPGWSTRGTREKDEYTVFQKSERLAREFTDQRLVVTDGNGHTARTKAGRIYAAFRVWCEEHKAIRPDSIIDNNFFNTVFAAVPGVKRVPPLEAIHFNAVFKKGR